LETIAEEVSPDKVVKDIVKELNCEHQDPDFEKTPSPSRNEEIKAEGSRTQQDEDPTHNQMEPQRTSEFEQTNLDEGNPTIEQDIPQGDLQAKDSTNPPTPEANVLNDNDEKVHEDENNNNPPLEEEHSATNTHQSLPVVVHDDHMMDTDEFLSSSSEYERTAKTGDSNADEGNSVSKPPSLVYLPPEVLQGLKDLAPDEALDKLLSSFGAFIPTLSDREKAMQLEQDDNEARFRREVIEGDMLDLLERNPSLYLNVKALFSRLQTPRTREDLFLLVTQAEAFLEQYAKHFQQLQLNSQAQHAKLKLKEQHFAQAKHRNDEANQMKAESTSAFL
jgi:hypothetical protein